MTAAHTAYIQSYRKLRADGIPEKGRELPPPLGQKLTPEQEARQEETEKLFLLWQAEKNQEAPQ